MIKTSLDEEDLIAPLVSFSSLRSLSHKTTRPNYEGRQEKQYEIDHNEEAN